MVDEKALVALVVEDEPLVRMNTVEAARDVGLQVIEAETGDEALTLIGSGLVPGLLVTDVCMPGQVDGVQLARQARALFPNIPIVIVSGYNSYPATEVSLDGTAEFVQKPYLPADLSDAIRRAMATAAPRDEGPAVQADALS